LPTFKWGYHLDMKRNLQPGKESPAISEATEDAPLDGYPPETDLIEEVVRGDDVLDSFQTRLFHRFRADFKHDTAVWASATPVIVHAIRTFGSEEKAYSWLVSSCGALNNELPYELLKAGKYEAVDGELDRIDYGVYV